MNLCRFNEKGGARSASCCRRSRPSMISPAQERRWQVKSQLEEYFPLVHRRRSGVDGDICQVSPWVLAVGAGYSTPRANVSRH